MKRRYMVEVVAASRVDPRSTPKGERSEVSLSTRPRCLRLHGAPSYEPRRTPFTLLALAGLVVLAGCGPPAPLSMSAPVAGQPVIVCLGDSATAGNAAPADQSYPAWLQRRLTAEGYRYRVINAGISGDRVGDGLARLDRDVLSFQPAIVIVELGSNDPGHTPRDQWATGLATIVRRLLAHRIRVFLAGLDEPGMGEVYRAIAAQYHVPLVWFTEYLWSRPGLWGDDHHPNGAGYHVVADTFWPALRPVLHRSH